MSSGIDSTAPAAGSATTLSVRQNFAAAKAEINELQRLGEGMEDTTGSGNSYLVTFSDNVAALTQGLRITVKANFENNAADPTITLLGLAATTIKTADGVTIPAAGIPSGTVLDLIYDAGDAEFLWLNPVEALLTKRTSFAEALLPIAHPIASILYSTSAINPGTINYFETGVTFGTWVAYASNRVVVGIDPGTVITAAASSSTIVTLTVASGHPYSAGEPISVSGLDTAEANVTDITIDSTTATTIVYTAAGLADVADLLDAGLELVTSSLFNASQEIGGSTYHTLTEDEMPSHVHTGDGFITSGFTFSFAGATGLFPSTGDDTGSTGGDSPHNNTQPYITTYIWTRTA